jgi:hypothetical protein
MCITTFLHDGEQNQALKNKEMSELLAEVREVTGENWQVIEREYITKFWFKENIRTLSYELYVEVGEVGPFQQINFYRDEMSSSINIRVTAELIIAYFYGMLSGIQCCKLKDKK